MAAPDRMKLGTPMSLLAQENHNPVSNDCRAGASILSRAGARLSFAAMDLCSLEILVAEWLAGTRAIRNGCWGVVLGVDRSAVGSNLSMKHLWIREETRCTASVPEDDSFTGTDDIVPDQRHKARHRLAGINRVQQNPLCAGH